jgi:hypothetical protein
MECPTQPLFTRDAPRDDTSGKALEEKKSPGAVSDGAVDPTGRYTTSAEGNGWVDLLGNRRRKAPRIDVADPADRGFPR